MEAAVDLGKVIEILEISDINSIKESELKKLRGRAKKRWHPDKISHTNPDPEIVKRYQENFVLIEEAIEFVRAHINGEVHVGKSSTGTYSEAVYEEPEDIIRRNAPEMQETLRSIWDSVRQQGYKLKEEIVTRYPGNLYKEMLSQDLKDNIPIFSIASFFFGFFLYLLLSLILSLVISSQPTILKFTMIALTFVWWIQAMACFLGLLPLSRFWLPQKIGDGVVYLINVGMNFFNIVDYFGLTRNTAVAFIFGIPLLLARIVQAIFVTPIYLIASMIIGDKTFGKVEEKVNYYADLADWYIEDLIHKDTQNLSSEELFALSHAYAELKGAE